MSVVLDEDTVVLDVLDFDVPCEAGVHAAHVSIACRQCADQAFYCQDHWEAKRRRVDEFLSRSMFSVVACSHCKAQAFTVEDLIQVVPL